MKRVKGFSYDTETDKDVIEHIEKQPVQNKYVWNLIRNDMNKSGNEIEMLVEKYVREMLKDMDVKKVDDNNVDINSVMDLLNLGK